MAQTFSWDQVQEMMTVMKNKMLDTIRPAIQPLIQRLDYVEINVALSNNKLAMLPTKSLNATLDSISTIVKVPLMNGGDPLSGYPRCMYSLVVAGNEKLPNDSQNTWNAGKSLALIREYDPGYETDGNDSYGPARKRRMVLTTHLGVTTYQLNSDAIV